MSNVLPAAAVIARLVKLRRHRGLTQAQIAERIGVKRTAYAGLESGHRKDVGVDELCRICAALEMDPFRVLSSEPIVLVLREEVAV